MSIQISEFTFPSSDGIHTLKGKLYLPDGDIKGIFQVVHGMTEHIDRYHEFMSEIANNGFVCFGFNNLGHKGTADDDELGFIAEKDGWKYLIRDVAAVFNDFSEKYPDGKRILMGHSMGSFIVRLTAAEYPDLADCLIVCGTGSNLFTALAGIGVASVIEKFYGKRHRSDFLQKIIFGAYNKGFEGLSKFDWLTNDRNIIELYEKDKYCTFRFSVCAIKDLLNLTYRANSKSWYKKLNKQLPILLISGDKDPVGAKGKGVKSIFKKLRISGHNYSNMFLYKNCRHEILNDICKEEVTADILDFIS